MKFIDRFLELRSPWLTLMGEHWLSGSGQPLSYWRVEKADSVIIVPVYRRSILLPLPVYRPGVAAATWDLPGGRVLPGQTPQVMVLPILQRELGLEAEAIASITPLNPVGWAINSSFSNQRLYGIVAGLHATARFDQTKVGKTVSNTPAGLNDLLASLTCLQCRAVVMDYSRCVGMTLT